jgi:hypothetical protein
MDTTCTATFGHSINPHAIGELKERTRSLLAAGVRMGTIDGRTGRIHGPRLPGGALDSHCAGIAWAHDPISAARVARDPFANDPDRTTRREATS